MLDIYEQRFVFKSKKSSLRELTLLYKNILLLLSMSYTYRKLNLIKTLLQFYFKYTMNEKYIY